MPGSDPGSVRGGQPAGVELSVIGFGRLTYVLWPPCKGQGGDCVTTLLKAMLAAVAGLALGLWATRAMLADGGPFDVGQGRRLERGDQGGRDRRRPLYPRQPRAQRRDSARARRRAAVDRARRRRGPAADPRCVYRVGPRAPAARYWTLGVVDRNGFPIENPAGRYVLRSSEILRKAAANSRSMSPRPRMPAIGCRSARPAPSRWCCDSMIRRSAPARAASKRPPRRHSRESCA